MRQVEAMLERFLFLSRWLLAPLYMGMVLMLGALLVVFFRELLGELAHIADLDGEKVILLALSLIDLSLTGNLLLIVILSGYENFVSKIRTREHEDRPNWMGVVDFSGLKIKLIASIVAISAIDLLRSFLSLGDSGAPVDVTHLRWQVAIHLTFVVSGVMLATMDWIIARSGHHAVREA